MIYIQSQQTTFPKAIYIGDKAELRCSFSSGTAIQTGTLSAQSFLQPIDFSLYDINEITLQKSGTDYYTLVINFTPWRTGQISFPDFLRNVFVFLILQQLQQYNKILHQVLFLKAQE